MNHAPLHLAMHGYGMIGRVHWLALQTAAQSPGMDPQVAWTHAILRDAANESARKAAIAFAQVHTSLDHLPWAEIDAIDVVSSNEAHAPVVAAAFAHGVPVYCEKPVSESLDETRRMAELANANPAWVQQVALMYRFYSNVEQAYHILRSGALGQPLTFRAELLHGGYLSPERPMSWRLQGERSGAGAILDLGVHMVDLIHFLLGPTAAVQAQVRTFVPTRRGADGHAQAVTVDDWAHLQLTLASGAVGSVEVSRVHYGREADRLEVVCQYGTIALDLHTDASAVVHSLPGHTVDLPPKPQLDAFRIPVKYSGDAFLRAHAAGLLTFLHRVRGGTLDYPVPTFADALAAEAAVHQALAKVR